MTNCLHDKGAAETFHEAGAAHKFMSSHRLGGAGIA